jgi:predicted transglutaminase-like cysteine proteinase
MLKDFVGNFFGFTKEIELLAKQKSALNTELNAAYSRCAQKGTRIEQLEKEVKDMAKQIPKPEPMETFYANKYPKADVDYIVHETDGNYEIDVRNFFQYHDSKLPTVTGSNDEKALKALLWVMANVKYVPDKQAYGFDEYWAFPWQTLKRKVGDCEDGAILLANILMKSGVPYWRVRLNAGDVKGGGHCYVTYCRETDNKFVVLDWCYWSNKKPVAERPTHEEERNYNDKEKNFYVWFSWNRHDAYGKMQTMAGMPAKFKRRKQ